MGQVHYDYGGETVLVTGGSSGIGRAIALGFADAGAAVVNADVIAEPKAADTPTHEKIVEEGGTADYVETDVSDPDEVRAAVDRAVEMGGIDVMVNNAGMGYKGDIFDVTEEDWDRVHAVNSKGVFFGTQAAAQAMIDREDPGVVVNTASINSFLALPDLLPYLSSKGSVRMITRGAALELADYDIRVNAVAPGHTATALGGGDVDERIERIESGEDLVKPIPLERIGMPEDIAEAVLFLASEDASHVTGELLVVDGGWQLF